MIDNIGDIISAFTTWLLSADFIMAIFDVLISVVMIIIGALMFPISALISNYFPDFNLMLLEISEVLDLALLYSGFIIDMVGFPPIIILSVVGYYTFVLSTQTTAYFFKVILNWYKAIT